MYFECPLSEGRRDPGDYLNRAEPPNPEHGRGTWRPDFRTPAARRPAIHCRGDTHSPYSGATGRHGTGEKPNSGSGWRTARSCFDCLQPGPASLFPARADFVLPEESSGSNIQRSLTGPGRRGIGPGGFERGLGLGF